MCPPHCTLTEPLQKEDLNTHLEVGRKDSIGSIPLTPSSDLQIPKTVRSQIYSTKVPQPVAPDYSVPCRQSH